MGRLMLPATVKPMVAVWILGRCGAEMLEAAKLHHRQGNPDLGRQFFLAYGQMQVAAAQLSNEAVAAAVTSGSGNAETEVGPELEASELSTPEAAERLGLTRERVCQLLSSGDLLGRKIGRAWQVNAQSVDDLLEARRTAA